MRKTTLMSRTRSVSRARSADSRASFLPVLIVFFGASLAPAARPAAAASFGNIDAAHARLITADGAVYSDTIKPVDQFTWFAVTIDKDHSYELSVWAPDNNILETDPNNPYASAAVTEADGTTSVTTFLCNQCGPLPFNASVGGNRLSLSNTAGTSRLVTIRVFKLGGSAAATLFPIYVRVLDTTLMAARWTVNGYQAFFALNNLGSSSASGSILYYAQDGTFLAADPFNISFHANLQIAKPNGVAIGGQLAGGVRIVFDRGGAGQVKAEEYLFNPSTGQYLTFDFRPAFQSGTGVQF